MDHYTVLVLVFCKRRPIILVLVLNFVTKIALLTTNVFGVGWPNFPPLAPCIWNITYGIPWRRGVSVSEVAWLLWNI